MTFEVSVESSGTGLEDYVGGSHMIFIESHYPGIIRLDRLLAQQLRISRTFIQELVESGRLHIYPGGKNALRKAAHTGQRILLSDSLPHEDSR